MQGILYNKQTKKIVNVFEKPELSGNRIKGTRGTVYFGDGLGIVFVPDDTVKIGTVDEKEEFTPDKIDENWITEPAPKTLEDRVKDLEAIIAEIKTKLGI